MPAFADPEWRPARTWLAQLCFRVGRWLMPGPETGRHYVVAHVAPGAILEIVPPDSAKIAALLDTFGRQHVGIDPVDDLRDDLPDLVLGYP